MKFFKELEVADICHPFEVAEWLALGRVPEFIHNGDYYSDDPQAMEARRTLGSAINGYGAFSGELVHTERELQSLDIEISFKEYIDTTFINPGYSTIAEAEKSIKQNAELAERLELQGLAERPDLKVNLSDEERRSIASIETIKIEVEHLIEMARTEVITAMVDGRLKLFGFQYPGHYMEEDLDENAELTSIPTNSIRISHFEWEESTLRTSESLFTMVHTNVDEMLKVFPTPRIKQVDEKVRGFGSTLISLENSGSSGPAQRLRIRKNNQPSISEVIRKEFERRYPRGASTKKKEAIYVEAIEWSTSVLGHTPGRSSVQRYLATLFKD